MPILGCGAADGELRIDVAEDGTVRIELVSESGEPVRGSDLYVRVRGVRTELLYAASAPVDTLCEQLPTAGPLVLRLTAPMSDCPEIHAAAYRHEPPEPADGEDPEPLVPVSERCSTHQSLLSTLIWSAGACGSPDAGILDAGPGVDGGTSDGADLLDAAGTSTAADASEELADAGLADGR